MYAKYGKAVITLLVAAAGAVLSVLGPGQGFSDLSTTSWLTAGLALLGSTALVWWVENVHGTAGGVIKTVQAFLSAGIPSLLLALSDGVITQSEWIVALVAAVTATGLVYQAPGPAPSPPNG